MHALSRDGFSRLRQLAILLALLNVALMAGVTMHLGGGVAAGARLDGIASSDPIALLGTRLGHTGCPTTPLAVGEGATVVCSGWTAILSKSGRVQVISIVGPGHGTIEAFRGSLPQGLHWGDSLTEVLAAIGGPNRITSVYGTPTFVYMYRGMPYGSLELRFSPGGRLQAINACLQR